MFVTSCESSGLRRPQWTEGLLVVRNTEKVQLKMMRPQFVVLSLVDLLKS